MWGNVLRFYETNVDISGNNWYKNITATEVHMILQHDTEGLFFFSWNCRLGQGGRKYNSLFNISQYQSTSAQIGFC